MIIDNSINNITECDVITDSSLDQYLGWAFGWAISNCSDLAITAVAFENVLNGNPKKTANEPNNIESTDKQNEEQKQTAKGVGIFGSLCTFGLGYLNLIIIFNVLLRHRTF